MKMVKIFCIAEEIEEPQETSYSNVLKDIGINNQPNQKALEFRIKKSLIDYYFSNEDGNSIISLSNGELLIATHTVEEIDKIMADGDQ